MLAHLSVSSLAFTEAECDLSPLVRGASETTSYKNGGCGLPIDTGLRRKSSKCVRCNSSDGLSLSHVIPRSFLKSILQKGSGKSIQYQSNGASKVKTSAQGADYLYCKDCEAFFNDRFDKFGFNECSKLFRETDLRNVLFWKTDSTRMVGFAFSVFMRAHFSNSTACRHYCMSNFELKAASSVVEESYCFKKMATVNIVRLKCSDGILSTDRLRDFVMFPVIHEVISKQGQVRRLHMFMAGGLAFSAFLPRLNRPTERKHSVITPGKPIPLVNKDLFEIPGVGEGFLKYAVRGGL